MTFQSFLDWSRVKGTVVTKGRQLLRGDENLPRQKRLLGCELGSELTRLPSGAGATKHTAGWLGFLGHLRP